MEFEYYPAKSLNNKEKHGIDFETIQRLWDDTFLVIIPAKMKDEPRFMAIGRIDQKIWSVIYTIRQDTIRLISARRARIEEVEFYERI